ncbi:alpha/beta hydrolase family protein [Actinomadura sp. WMMB 499]|uniref:alpha/beta hydrolase n=1 Tax=Actinomadura sp. WMMB 499 TaxID=1219491 RepID=UPI0012465C9E|nr:alpha/beta hydrolase-fold protein [Actinomadura sp. WMMB 499]QFG23388.1 esterase family protein [Actinomadura sp. WMMB 499]
MLSRRAFIGGGAAAVGGLAAAGGGVALVEHDVLPGRVRLHRMLGRCGDLPAPPPEAGSVQTRTFRSHRRGRDVAASIVLPAGTRSVRGLRVAVALHGNGATGPGTVSGLALDRYLTQAVRRGAPPFALVAADGGADSYWHPRADGDDPLGMILDELLPHLAREGARTDRFGAIGWSMGGFGALVLGRRVGAPRMAAVVGSSPAIFESYEDARSTNRHAFDDADDFARHDVLRHLDRLDGVPVRVDCGTGDAFTPMVRKLRERLHPEGRMTEGCHDAAFWRARLPAQLDFLAHHLAGPRGRTGS